MKNCPRCGSTVSENGMFCLNCGYKYSEETNEPYQNNEDHSSNIYGQGPDSSFVLSVLSIVFSSISIFVVIMGGLAVGFAGPAFGIVLCIISLIMAINAHHADESKTLPKVAIWLSFGFIILNLFSGAACLTLFGGKDFLSGLCDDCTGCSSKSVMIDGTQCNPFYKK